MQKFSTQPEEPDQSVSVTFEPSAIQPPLTHVVSCALFTAVDGRFMLLRHPGGFDLASLVRADDEEPEACVYRIAEACGIDITEPQFIGQWVLRKNFDSPLNAALPAVSYQLLFIADVSHQGEFTPSAELSERVFVSHDELAGIHRDHDNFRDIFEYARERFDRVP